MTPLPTGAATASGVWCRCFCLFRVPEARLAAPRSRNGRLTARVRAGAPYLGEGRLTARRAASLPRPWGRGRGRAVVREAPWLEVGLRVGLWRAEHPRAPGGLASLCMAPGAQGSLLRQAGASLCVRWAGIFMHGGLGDGLGLQRVALPWQLRELTDLLGMVLRVSRQLSSMIGALPWFTEGGLAVATA